MASIKRRKYWANPVTGKEVRKGTPGAVVKEFPHYRIRILRPSGEIISAKGYRDLRATEQLAARLQLAADRGEEGMVNRFAKHDRRPLWGREVNGKVQPGHVDDYIADLAARKRDDKYIYNMARRLKRLAEECHWKRLRDITPASFSEWRRARSKELGGKRGGAGQTINQWYDSVNAFLNWCAMKEQGRIAANPLAGLEPLPESPTFVRRALGEEQLEGLYAGGARDGANRWRVYAFIATTGLRRQETEDLRWSDVVIDAPVEFLKLRDYATKARRADVFALRSEIAGMLRAMRPAKWKENDPVFPEGVPTVEQFLEDLRAGGVAVPDEESIEKVDVHALRTTLGSFLGKSGMPERTAMELLRVTDPKLLRKTYCDPRILQTAQAVQRVTLPVPVQIRTNDLDRDRPPLVRDAGPNFTVSGDNALPFQGVVRDCPRDNVEGDNSAGRTRTYNIPVNSGMLYH